MTHSNDVLIKSIEQAKEAAKHTTGTWVSAIKTVVTGCFENAETVPKKYSTMILNTEDRLSIEQDDEFGIEGITTLYDFDRVPLQKAGFSGSLLQFTEQWQLLYHYSIKYLAPGSTDYRIV